MPPIEFRDEDLFPDCSLENCERASEGIHQHILPDQREILEWICGKDREDFFATNKNYTFWQGGVGAGKSIPVSAAVVKLSLMIPCNRGVVGREDFKLLYKSTWRDVKGCLSRLVRRGIIREPHYQDKRQGDYTTIHIRENDSEIYALQTKKWTEGLGAGYGWFFIDDAMASPEELFVGDETNAGLVSRLRPFVRDYTENVPLRFRGIAVTNPPPYGHWLHKLFGKQEGFHKLGDDPVKVKITETFKNPFVGDGYALGLMAIQQKMGRSSNTARRVIFGESQPAYGGVKVFPNFSHQRHVAELEVDTNLPVVCGVDFGFHHPGAIFSNLWRCEYGENHYYSLSEVGDQLGVTVWTFWEAVITHRKLYYPNCIVYNGGDKSGYRASASNKDKRGDMKIVMADYHEEFEWRQLELKSSLTYMRGLLDKTCKCGKEIIQIDKKCELLLGGLEGGYKYSKSRITGQVSEKPIEDRWFADIAAAWRYGAECYVKWGVPRTYTSTPTSSPPKERQPWDWMNLSDQEFSKLILTP